MLRCRTLGLLSSSPRAVVKACASSVPHTSHAERTVPLILVVFYRQKCLVPFLVVCRRPAIVAMGTAGLETACVFAGNEPCNGARIRAVPAPDVTRYKA